MGGRKVGAFCMRILLYPYKNPGCGTRTCERGSIDGDDGLTPLESLLGEFLALGSGRLLVVFENGVLPVVISS